MSAPPLPAMCKLLHAGHKFRKRRRCTSSRVPQLLWRLHHSKWRCDVDVTIIIVVVVVIIIVIVAVWLAIWWHSVSAICSTLLLLLLLVVVVVVVDSSSRAHIALAAAACLHAVVVVDVVHAPCNTHVSSGIAVLSPTTTAATSSRGATVHCCPCAVARAAVASAFRSD